MKNFFNFKALVLSFVMAMLCVVPVSAQQSDDFFSVGDEYGGTRDAITYWTATNGIGNNGIGQSEAPVGSGLLILTAVGAGYAIYRRKHNFKNGTTLLLAFALLFGMTQCKKNVETITPMSNTVHITLNVDGGSRVSVTPGDEFATVTFEEGDVIYVGYNNACIGSLAYDAGQEKFGGNVAFVPQVGDEPLYFYFLGNKTPTITETTKYTVDIIDQTSKYPVISYNHSNEVYTGAGEYTATLFNYCSIMKFVTNDVADINSQVLCITGMNNTVTVDFNGNDITYGSKDDGLIKMPISGSNVRWAIVLSQEELAAGSYGSVYTANGYYTSRPEMDEVLRNQYLKDPISIGEMDEGFDLSKGSFNNSEISNADIYQSNNGTATANTITIADGQKVFLNGVNIKAVNTNAIVCKGDAEIVLSGTNTVKSESPSGDYTGTLAKAVIKAGAYEPTKTTLTISGNGSLNVSPQKWASATSSALNGAGIGANYEGNCGNIVINSGTITVSGVYGAAIGSGRVSTGTSKCGSITINGGTISATSSTGAGIGSGGRAWVSSSTNGKTSCDGITINGGTVTARSVGGAAIGAGKCEGGGTNSDSYCGNILITGGTVDAQTTNTSDYAGAAIGGGYQSKAGNITISGGNVKAFGHRNSAGIGSGGCNSQCGNILINGGSVDTQGGYGSYEGAGIGTGKGSANNAKSICGTITITDGVTIVKAYNVYGSSYRKNIGVGSLSYAQCGAVSIPGVSGTDGIAGGSQYIYKP